MMFSATKVFQLVKLLMRRLSWRASIMPFLILDLRPNFDLLSPSVVP